MQIFLYLMYGVEFVIAVLLILVILIQRSKAGGGLGGLATTSSGVEDAFGSDAGNVLVRVTWILGSVFLVSTITIGILQGFIASHEDSEMGDEDYMNQTIEEKKTEELKMDAKADVKADAKADEKAAPATDVKADEKTAPATDVKADEKAAPATDAKKTEK